MTSIRSRSLGLGAIGTILVAFSLCSCGGGGTTESSGPPPPPPPASNFTIVSLAAKHLVFDSTRQLLYASISSADPQDPNTVAVIAPGTGTVMATIPVGHNPNELALSRDAKYLYVGADGDGTVQRIDLSSQQVVLTIPLAGDRTALSMSVMPGSSSTVAVDLGIPFTSPPSGGIAIFDDATARPNTITADEPSVDQIAFSDSGDTLYGAEIATSGWAFSRFNVDANGLTLRDSFPQIFQGYADGMVYSNGKIYTYHGWVFDPTDMNLLGSFPFSGAQPPFIDSAGHAYYPVSPSTSPVVVNQFATSNYVKTGSLSITPSNNIYYTDLVGTGGNDFAFVGGPPNVSSSAIIISTQAVSSIPASTPTLSNLPVNHLVYDSTRQRIYASVPSSAGSSGNSIAVINPVTSAIETFIPVGSEPDVMALSSDASYLYVALDGAASIARVNLSGGAVDQTFPVGIDTGVGFAGAISIAAMPGSPGTVAVATRELAAITAEFQVIVFDNGVPRPNSTPPAGSSDLLAFSDSPDTLYGFDLGSFVTFHVDATGASAASLETPGLVLDRPNQMESDGGLVYASDGFAIDPSKPARAGIYPIGATRGFVVDDAAGEVYFLADDRLPNQGFSAIFAFDKNTFVYRGKMDVSAHWGQGFDLVECGASCFAYATSPGVTVVAADFTAATPPALSELPVYHLLYDPGRDLIYASVSGGVPGIGNSIVTIDPTSQTIQGSAYVGSEPDPMALSPDGSALYVGLDGAGSVVKVDLPAGTAEPPFWLGNNSISPGGGPLFAQSMSVMPGNPNVVAITRTNNNVAIFDNGAQLPSATDSPFITINSIAFGDASDLYGFDNATTGFDFYRMKVNASGVTISDDQPQLIYGFGTDIVFDSGFVYSTNGRVVDPIQDTIAETFSGASSGLSVALDDTANRAYFLTYNVNSQSSAIMGYQKDTSVLLGTQPVGPQQPYTAGLVPQSFDLIHYSSGLAYATATGNVVFANVSFPALPNLPLSQLPANHLIYDSTRQVIYASIPGRGGAAGDTIAVINPSTGGVVSSIPIGSEPGVMSLSSDNNYLYVGLQGAAVVKRINLGTQQVGLDFGLGADSFFGPKFAQDISVMPGNSSVVAVAQMYPGVVPPAAGVSIFNQGALLPNFLTSRQQSNSLAFSSNPSILYGFENDQTSFNFNRMQVDSNGVTLTDATGGLISGVATIRFDGGLIYSTTGTVVDPVATTVVGSFPGVGLADAVVLDDTLGRAFFLTYDSTAKTVSILAFNKATYQLIGSATVTGATAEGTDLARWGTDGFAVSTSNEIILIPNSSLAQ